jgi:hypothetical protein
LALTGKAEAAVAAEAGGFAGIEHGPSPNLTPTDGNCGARIDAPFGFGILDDNPRPEGQRVFFARKFAVSLQCPFPWLTLLSLFMFRARTTRPLMA